MRKISAAAVCVLLVLAVLLGACSRREGNLDFGEYVLTTEGEPGSRVVASYDPDKVLDVDYTWSDKYTLTYDYFDAKTGESLIEESKCETCFRSVDKTSGQMTYITQEDGYLLEYALEPKDMTGAVTVVTDSDIKSLHSGFFMLSAVDPYYPVYANVTYTGEETVAGRKASSYMQVEKDDSGEIIKTAYICIDDEYSFASSCSLYDSVKNELLLKWELKSFSPSADENKIRVDISSYTIS